MITKQTLPLTKTQKIILLLLYKFRFLTIIQLQNYFNHKDPHRIKEWLKDLTDKKCVYAIKDLVDITKPYIFCLDTKSRTFLKSQNCNKNYLDRIYKEKNLQIDFINHCLFIFDLYLFFKKRLKKNTNLNYCTSQEISEFIYLPKDLDAYIEVTENNNTQRYFLELFDEFRKSPGQIRFALRKHIDYAQDGDWQANTNLNVLPNILFVLDSERKRKHLKHYGEYKLKKTFEDISAYSTTINAIKFADKNSNIWSKI